VLKYGFTVEKFFRQLRKRLSRKEEINHVSTKTCQTS
jgi:hypothetical protein